MTGVLAVDVGTAIFAILPLLFPAVPEPPGRGEGAEKTPLLEDVRAGLRYLRGLPGHLALVGFAAGINRFVVPAFALLPLLVLNEIRGDIGIQAWLTAALGIGVLPGGLVLAIWGGFRSRVRTALAAIVRLRAAIVVLGTTPAGLVPLAAAAMLAVGALSAVANGCIAAVFQATVAPDLQGRVFALLASAATAMTPVGPFLAAPLAEWAGVRAWYVAGGIACAAMGAGAFLVRSIVELEGRPVEGAFE